MSHIMPKRLTTTITTRQFFFLLFCFPPKKLHVTSNPNLMHISSRFAYQLSSTGALINSEKKAGSLRHGDGFRAKKIVAKSERVLLPVLACISRIIQVVPLYACEIKAKNYR